MVLVIRLSVLCFLDKVPCLTSITTFLVRRDTAVTPSLSPAVFAGLLRPLGADVWWTLAAMLLALSLVLRLSLRFNSPRAEDGRLVRDMGWGSCLLAGAMTVVGQGWDRTPQSLAGRTVTIFGWMLGILIYINYTANLMSFLTTHTVKRPISSLREFVQQPDWSLALLHGSHVLNDLRTSTNVYERKPAEEWLPTMARLRARVHRLGSGLRGSNGPSAPWPVGRWSDYVGSTLITGNDGGADGCVPAR
ncbi:Ionotropic receptor 25a [Amphibalanus amphitrite]|uniref:Ionotropic receptor 25a n=1 Tax=Amphibalanus amphitrite TaxID=1232801 RepID=A0A6A4WYR5_AMPAM|nr:Ionotropic receptor 25a [Amphibalanus amphitrite]